MPLSATRDVWLGNLRHRNRRLYAGRGSGLFEKVLQREGIHYRTQHAHVVGPGPVHAALAQLGAAKKVATTDNNGDFNIAGWPPDHLAFVGVDRADDVECAHRFRPNRRRTPPRKA